MIHRILQTIILVLILGFCIKALGQSTTYSGVLNHTNSYLTIHPYSSTYDDGTYAKVYYDGQKQRIVFQNSASGILSGGYFREIRAGRLILKDENDNNQIIDFGYTDKLHFTHGGNYNTKILTLVGTGASGNVGIRTDAPQAPLHVNGDIRSNSAIRAGRLILKDEDTDTQVIDFGYNGKMHITHGNNPDDAFKIMTFVGQGKKVGIGTTNPDHELTVKGTIHAEEVLVDLNVPGPDYVFEEDYPLQDLSSLEQYLKTNKHLPEVPSASEMEKDGIKVGEMEMLLLKKVEELTLHIIRQEKEIEKLKERLDDK